MAKKKNGKGSGNPVLDALTDMLGAMSPEERMQLMANLEKIAQSESPVNDLLEVTYTYQCPDYTREVKPLAEIRRHPVDEGDWGTDPGELCFRDRR